jgi:hypothetical protein
MSGGNRFVLIGEECARTPDATLHLIVDQQQLVRRTQRAQPLEITRAGDVDPPLTLDGLDHDGAGCWRDHLLERLQVIERRISKAFQQWLKTFMILVLRRGREGCHGTAVEGIFEGDDLVASGSEVIM